MSLTTSVVVTETFLKPQQVSEQQEGNPRNNKHAVFKECVLPLSFTPRGEKHDVRVLERLLLRNAGTVGAHLDRGLPGVNGTICLQGATAAV